MLDRDEILKVADLKRQKVHVPEWDGDVILSEMSAADRLEFERLLTTQEPHVRVLLVAFCAVDESGERLFSLADVEALGKKNFRAIHRLSEVALRLNALGSEQETELKENFTASQG